MDEFYALNGYEGLYEWNPKTKEVRGLKSGKVLQWRYNHSGRPRVVLCKNGVAREFFKAMLVYSHANKCEIPFGYEVHHIDGNKDNNDPNNLKLLTKTEHRKLHGLNEKAVIAVDEQNRIVHRFASTQEAARNGFDQGAVSKACRGKYSTHKGHYYESLYWYYED